MNRAEVREVVKQWREDAAYLLTAAGKLSAALESPGKQDGDLAASLETDHAEGSELCARCMRWSTDVKVGVVEGHAMAA